MKLSRLRRFSQIFFLALFLFLLCKTEFRGSAGALAADFRLPYPVSLFLQADPLAALSTALSTRTLYRGLLWSLVILIPTFFLGRLFCGWICPLGTLNHFFSRIKSERKRGKALIDLNRYKAWQRLKYYVLVAVLVAALFGCGLAGILDPVSLAVRSVALSVLPGANVALNALFDSLYETRVRALKFTADALHFLLKDTIVSFRQPHFRQALFLGLIFAGVLLLNLRITRFWCRALCPLGALLGLASRWSILGLVKRAGRCEDCNRCLLGCQGGDDPIPGAPWRKAECHLCFNCVEDCPENALAFRFFPGAAATAHGPNLQRRKALVSAGAGLALIPLFRSTAVSKVERHERLIRPPGALDEKNFLERCIRCGECMKVCPNNALQPTLLEAGLEGIWTPVLAPRIGYCEPACVLCGQVCPTGAIWEITSEEKGWGREWREDSKPVRVGTAFYDRGRCLPWAMATECIVCEEWCPTSPKAIYLRPAEVVDAEGRVRQVRQPYLDPERCVGCGACEFACPVRDRAAVYVTSVGESRSKTNQILLRRPRQSAPLPETGDAHGWSKAGATRVFEAADLWRYIDGGAERFLRAGVVKTFTSEYRHETGIEAVADVHVMKSPEGARQLFESEPTEGSRPMAAGDAGRAYGTSLVFRKGPHFVRLVAYQDAPHAASALLELARAIERKLGA